MDVQTVIVGAGQAGLALSRRLTALGHEHLVLERGRIGERWRSERPDALTLLTPNWLNTLPDGGPHRDPDGFLGRAGFVEYLDEYARRHALPVHKRTPVRRARRLAGGGFELHAGAMTLRAASVVAATGDCARVRRPAAASALPGWLQAVPANAYRSPAGLIAGAVLVVGAGPSGQQIALELARAGRDVVLAVGRHARMPRRHRGRDIWWWLEQLGEVHRDAADLPDLRAAAATPSLPLSGAHGGRRLDLGVLAADGVRIVGRLLDFEGRHARFDDRLAERLADAERRMARVLGKIERHVAQRADRASSPAPEPVARLDLSPAPRRIDLGAAGITSVVWATGYERDWSWLGVSPGEVHGRVRQRNGVTALPGLHVLGTKLQSRRSSHLIGGVGHDAADLARELIRCD